MQIVPRILLQTPIQDFEVPYLNNKVLICGSGVHGFRRRPRCLISQDCPSSHPRTTRLARASFSLFLASVGFPSSSSLPSTSLLIVALCQVEHFSSGNRSLCQTTLPCRSLRVALSREGASRRTPHTTAPHTFTYRTKANCQPAELLHASTQSHPSLRTLPSRHTSPVIRSTALFARGG